MKQTSIFLLVLLLAMPAWAESVMVFDGAMQNGWSVGAFSILDAPGQTAGTKALAYIGLTDWKSIGGQNPIQGNTFLEFDVYFDTQSGSTSTSFGIIQESWDSDAPRYEMKDLPDKPVWYINDVLQSTAAYQYTFAADTWQHFTLDLTSSMNGNGIPADGNFGIIFGNWTGAADMYLMNVEFTPEPATLALLGAGALAILRKRQR